MLLLGFQKLPLVSRFSGMRRVTFLVVMTGRYRGERDLIYFLSYSNHFLDDKKTRLLYEKLETLC